MLARDLHMTVAELGVRMSAAEFAQWTALYAQEAVERAKAEDDAKRGR